jgi:hypothetical protein
LHLGIVLQFFSCRETLEVSTDRPVPHPRPALLRRRATKPPLCSLSPVTRQAALNSRPRCRRPGPRQAGRDDGDRGWSDAEQRRRPLETASPRGHLSPPVKRLSTSHHILGVVHFPQLDNNILPVKGVWKQNVTHWEGSRKPMQYIFGWLLLLLSGEMRNALTAMWLPRRYAGWVGVGKRVEDVPPCAQGGCASSRLAFNSSSVLHYAP